MKPKLHIVTVSLLVLGCLNAYVVPYMRQGGALFGHRSVIGVIVAVSAFFLAFQRDFYLPFLGPCAIAVPTTSSPKDAGVNVLLEGIPPNAKVIFWAAKPSAELIDNPWAAYGAMSNAGWTTSDKDGKATATIACPAEYTVPRMGVMRKRLPKHVHYRYLQANGLYSRVFTQNVTCATSKEAL